MLYYVSTYYIISHYIILYWNPLGTGPARLERGAVVLETGEAQGEPLSHLSNTTCLTHVFFKSGEQCGRFN